MNWGESAILCLVACVVTILLVPPVKKLAIKIDAVDYPDKRRVNKEPTPRLGGVAMLAGIIVALALLLAGIAFWGWRNPFVPHPDLSFNYIGVGISCLLMFAVGVADDICDLNPRLKLLGQVVAACVAVASGLLLDHIHIPLGDSYLEFGLFAYPLTVFYLVAFANIINLIDGLDGLASGITAISALALLAFTVITERPDVAVLCAILFGACVGFLRYNFHPASIFMGDSGALLLGYFLGCVSLMAIAKTTFFISLLVPVIIAGVPVIDTATAIVRRVSAHQPVDQADKDHIHHRLLNAGFSHRTTVLIMWAWTAVLSILAVLMTSVYGVWRFVVLIAVIFITAVVVVKLHLMDPVLSRRYEGLSEVDESSEEAAGSTQGEVEE